MFPFLACCAALAAPPSSTLSGPAGTLTWTIAASGDQVVVDGRSPKWTVHHVATADLRPVRTERSDDKGARVTVDYTADGAIVRTASGEAKVTGTDLWDGDTVDVRLGDRAAKGKADVTFRAVDPASGTVYGFEATTVGSEGTGATATTHVHLVMTGVYRLVGPTWDYWYATDGRLVRFEGPIGTYTAGGAR